MVAPIIYACATCLTNILPNNEKKNAQKGMGSVRTEDDENFEVWLQKKTFTYDSPQIQNEIINIMSHEIVLGPKKNSCVSGSGPTLDFFFSKKKK